MYRPFSANSLPGRFWECECHIQPLSSMINSGKKNEGAKFQLNKSAWTRHTCAQMHLKISVHFSRQYFTDFHRQDKVWKSQLLLVLLQSQPWKVNEHAKSRHFHWGSISTMSHISSILSYSNEVLFSVAKNTKSANCKCVLFFNFRRYLVTKKTLPLWALKLLLRGVAISRMQC